MFTSFSFQRFTPIETTALNISACAMAICLRAGGCLSQLHASHETCFRNSVASPRFSKPFLARWVPQVPVNSLDVLPDLHRDIVPVVPLCSAQIHENPKWYHFIPSVHVIVTNIYCDDFNNVLSTLTSRVGVAARLQQCLGFVCRFAHFVLFSFFKLQLLVQ